MGEHDEPSAPVRIELRSLSVYTHHGVTEAEREVGQRLELDVTLLLGSSAATGSDDLADTVDYSAVSDLVVSTATGASYHTLERLAAVLGERLVASFEVDAAVVRAAKPEPPLAVSIGSVAVTVTTRAPGK